MTLRPRPLLPLAALALLASCAYYNGLYNAKDLARRAEKAERQGKTLEAQDLWGQVAVKAETVLVRHPHSKWTEEARFLHGNRWNPGPVRSSRETQKVTPAAMTNWFSKSPPWIW